LVNGNRIGKAAILSPDAVAIIFDEVKEKVLLTRRSDNSRGAYPVEERPQVKRPGRKCGSLELR
jgi:hypothetical protein